MRDPSQKSLVDGLRRGDRAAFDRAFDLFRVRIYAFLVRLSGRRDVADDLFQETFMKLARAAPTLHEDTDLAAWLYTVARNEWISWRRWTMFDVSRLVSLREERNVFLGTDADARLDASRSIARLDAALAHVSAKHREVLVLVAIEGLDQSQAAAILGLRCDALRQRLSRARAELVEHLGEEDELARDR